VVARLALSTAALVLSAFVLALTGCSDALPTTPTPATRPIGQTGLSGGGGGADPGTSTSLVGEWEVLLAFSLPDDIITTRTNWRFDDDGGCSRTVTTLSAAEGIPLTNVRECTFTIGPAELVVSYAGGEVARFDLSLLALPDTILLDGLAYQRVA
jgi:hypothetical protein